MTARDSMAPSEVGAPQPSAPTSLALTAGGGRVRTGARLGPLRTLIGVVAIILGVRHILWQVSIAPGSVLGVLFVVTEVGSLLLFTMTVVTLCDRGTRAPGGAPGGTLDVFLTVCGEPAHIVEASLRSAIAIEYPHRTVVLNDGRLAGKAGWEDIDRLGRDLGCEVITRVTGARGKAGNLNHGLASSNAQFIATIDADHCADTDLATRTLGWFTDPQVAFVTTGQRFVGGVDVLNPGEDFFFGAIQPAKDAAGCAISCGNGVVYRRAALDGIGGFSEWNVVEDLHTSYRLHRDGWTSVYERQPVTTGLAPPTVGEYARQRSRWALDTFRLLLFDSPLRRRGLTFRQRLHYLQTTGFYLLTLLFPLYLVGPPLYILGRVSTAGGASITEYTQHALPYLGSITLLIASIVGPVGAFRTFRSTLFNSFFLLPALLGAVAGHRASGVTRKVAPRRSSWLLAPQLVAAVLLTVSLVVAIVDERSGQSPIAIGWAAVLTGVVVAPLAALTSRPALVRRSAMTAQALVVVLGLVAVAGAWQASTGGQLSGPSADPRSPRQDEFAVPRETIAASPPTATRQDTSTVTTSVVTGAAPASAPRVAASTSGPKPIASGPNGPLQVPARGAYLGVAAEGIQREPEAFDEWSAAHAGARPAIVHWFQHWGSGENRFRADWVANVSAAGSVPMITWEPWAKPDGLYADPQQTEFRLEAILAGEFDVYIRSWADGAATYGGPLLLRFMHEFNGEWYPWSIGLHGQTPAQFVAAWRHVHGIFEAAGATNVSWVWSTIRGFSDPGPAYPGDDVVDWVAATVLNTGVPAFGGWLAYGFLIGDLYDRLEAYGKPVMLAEVATTADGDTAVWWDDLLATVRRDQPLVRAVVAFDMPYNDDIDYRLTPDASSVIAVATQSGWFASRP